VIANASPVKDEAGTVLAGIMFFTDLTERRQAERYKSTV